MAEAIRVEPVLLEASTVNAIAPFATPVKVMVRAPLSSKATAVKPSVVFTVLLATAKLARLMSTPVALAMVRASVVA